MSPSPLRGRGVPDIGAAVKPVVFEAAAEPVGGGGLTMGGTKPQYLMSVLADAWLLFFDKFFFSLRI